LEEEKVKEVQKSDEDEIGKIIQREQIEHERAEQEKAKR
jgi:hypothetical protein